MKLQAKIWLGVIQGPESKCEENIVAIQERKELCCSFRQMIIYSFSKGRRK